MRSFLYGPTLISTHDYWKNHSFDYMQHCQHIIRNAGLEEAQAGIKIAGRNTNNLSYADDTTPMAETKEDEPLDEGERGE